MHTSPITKIVIHCSATQNGKQLRTATQTAAQLINDWHKQRDFRRLAGYYKQFNPHLQHIGYHFVIDTNGTVETGRKDGKNHGEYTEKQWQTLHNLLRQLEAKYPSARICGLKPRPQRRWHH